MKNELYFTKKAKHFEEALPVGNGRIGGLVFGDLKKERIALNEDTLWSGYPKEKNKQDAHMYLDEARNALFSKDYEKAKRIINKDMHGCWSESYLPFGDLIIEYSKANKHNYERRLDFETGVATVTTDAFKESVFVSHPSQLMVVNIQSDNGISFKVKLDSQLIHNTECEDDCLLMTGKAPEVCMPNYYDVKPSIVQGDKGMGFCAAVKVIGDAKFGKDYIQIENSKNTTLLISLATGYIDFKSMPTADSKKRALEYFKGVKSYDEMLKEHIDDFSALFNRVNFTLEGKSKYRQTPKRIKAVTRGADDNELIATLFQYGRYLTISASRKGSQAMNLQGIWNVTMRAPWSSNYTININTQMNYWCTDIANLSECFEPLVELVKRLSENGRETARAYYNSNGFCSHHNSDIWAMTQPATAPDGEGDFSSYAPWSSSAPWLLNQLYDHYLYTLDEEYKKELVTMFGSCLEFYKDFLIEHNSELVTCPSISPENTFIDNGNREAITYMPSMDRGILYEFFENCRELGLDAPEINPVGIASDGRIPEWAEEYEETDIEHRHVSHLYCIYPARATQSEELNKAAEKSLNVRGFGGTGWSLGWKVCLWARLKNGNNALKLIKQQLTYIDPVIKIYHGGGSYPNLFDAHPPFQIDGNFGVCAGIAEMLKNKALPDSWSGEISGIMDYGQKEIAYKFKNGKEI